MKLFDELGASLQAQWGFADHDEERFADLGAAALDGFAERFDKEAFYDAMLDDRRGGRQHLAPVGAFGQPGITAFHGEGFVIEVYVWTNSISAIHNHPFCGAFTILEGWSVHARYQTSRPMRAGSRGQLLDVRLVELERLGFGDVRKFSLRRHPLIHALVHVPIPTISMVVRTTRTEGYYRYLPPSLALPMEAPSEPASRRVALLEALVRNQEPSALARVCAALREAEFEVAVHLMSVTWPHADPQVQAALCSAFDTLHGDRREALESALHRAGRLEQATAIRQSLRDPTLRLCATALAYAEDRAQAFRLLEDEEDPLAAFHTLVREAGLFTPEEEASQIIAASLVDGLDDDAILERLRERYGHDAIEAQREELLEFAKRTPFAVLRSN